MHLPLMPLIASPLRNVHTLFRPMYCDPLLDDCLVGECTYDELVCGIHCIGTCSSRCNHRTNSSSPVIGIAPPDIS